MRTLICFARLRNSGSWWLTRTAPRVCIVGGSIGPWTRQSGCSSFEAIRPRVFDQRIGIGFGLRDPSCFLALVRHLVVGGGVGAEDVWICIVPWLHHFVRDEADGVPVIARAEKRQHHIGVRLPSPSAECLAEIRLGFRDIPLAGRIEKSGQPTVVLQMKRRVSSPAPAQRPCSAWFRTRPGR